MIKEVPHVAQKLGEIGKMKAACRAGVPNTPDRSQQITAHSSWTNRMLQKSL